MKEISIKFVDFWPSLDVNENNFTRALRSKFNVRVIPAHSREIPDILFYSVFGNEHYRYRNCVKVYYTGENDVPDFNECDYALSFHHIDFGERHMRYPLYMTYELADALNPPMLSDSAALDRGFCSLLMRDFNNCDRRRLQIIDAVADYKPIAYGGPFRNNIGGPVEVDGKIPFIAKYKFNLALENSALPGYITEKIVEPFAAPTVPIYWGAPDIADEFNPEAFINVDDYESPDTFISSLREIDNDSRRYLSMLRAPRLRPDQSVDFNERLADFLCKIADDLKIQRPMSAMSENFYRRNYILKRTFGHDRLINTLARIMKV